MRISDWSSDVCSSDLGSMNDLNAAKLEDVKQWFRTWYGPNNAVLVLAGDIDVETAKKKVARYFGDIPASPTMTQPEVAIAPLAASRRTVRSEEHTSELQSLMRISYAVLCLKKKKKEKRKRRT